MFLINFFIYSIISNISYIVFLNIYIYIGYIFLFIEIYTIQIVNLFIDYTFIKA